MLLRDKLSTIPSLPINHMTAMIIIVMRQITHLHVPLIYTVTHAIDVQDVVFIICQ